MSVIVCDNFNRANSTGLGANWSAGSGQTQLNVSSNTATGPSGYGQSYWSADSIGADQFCRAKPVSTVNASGRHGYVGVRTNNGSVGGGYWLEFNDTNYRLYYTDSGGTDHNFESGATGFTTSDFAEIRVSGTTINGWKNGVKLTADYTDSNISSGPPAIGCTDNNTTIDDFQAGDLPGILFDSESHGAKGTSDTNPLTLSHPTGSGLTAAHLDVFVRLVGAPTQTVSTLTYDGTGMTFVSRNTSTGDNFNTVEHWKLPLGNSPSSGSKNIVITPSAACRIIAWAVIRQNVDQSSPFHGSDTFNEGSSTTATNSATASAGELVVDGAAPSGGKTLTCSTSLQVTNYGPSDVIVGSENSGVGTVTNSWTLNLSDIWFSLIWVLKPNTAPTAPPVESWMCAVSQPLQRASEVVGY